MSGRLTRTIVFWCPDWPVVAAGQAAGHATEVPLALIDRGLVFACSAAARRDGVRRGLRVREAQYRCTGLVVAPYDPVQDSRAFEPVISRIEEITPGVQVVRPGTCAIRSRGPSRYYGGEEQAAEAVIRCLLELGIEGARIGIADGPFAAEQAARATVPGAPVHVVPPGGSPAFLAPLPIGILAGDRLATLLRRLGVHTLGEFAALDAGDVRRRFGADGAFAHEKAGGRDSRSVVPRVPPKLFDADVVFEPALDRTDQVTFGIRATADRFIETLTAARLVCTAVRVAVYTESGEVSERVWLHPRWFSPGDVVDRVRWQLQGGQAIDTGLRSGVARVHISPERMDSTAHHEQGLWGSGPDERIHHGLTRVQSMLGHEGVLTAVIGGGRLFADRQVLVPWGDRPAGDGRAEAEPWPGSLPGVAPATVFPARQPVALLQADGAPVDVDDRGLVTGEPAHFSPTGSARDYRDVEAWAGPWPVTERWWDAEHGRALHRFQLVDTDGNAWLLTLEDHRWWAEGCYD
ncbi:DNA polymerase Y family protein [Cryobacterium tepidiphilum]|uniref:DNA polymerase Y family protein n=1 Tax=Cryobacterium tepidiphilum TaxID=2486026 RepID=A0A3M8LP22_9MICO|nr:DNA polymerase Y family protein [Cryobacterium tepidiphilum]RNE66464.1 DNA polymerase Y family protein [Cryobacterium tepidiphilum]